MKPFFILLPALIFMGCSGPQKQTDTTSTTTPATKEAPKAEAKADPNVVKKEVCESGDDKRMLAVLKTGSGCDLSYTKFGKEKVVASGKFGVKHCEASFDKITKKLEADNFNCSN